MRVALVRTGLWLPALGRVGNGFSAPAADFSGVMESSASGWGELSAIRHAAEFSHTPTGYRRTSMPPGSHPLTWPAA